MNNSQYHINVLVEQSLTTDIYKEDILKTQLYLNNRFDNLQKYKLYFDSLNDNYIIKDDNDKLVNITEITSSSKPILNFVITAGVGKVWDSALSARLLKELDTDNGFTSVLQMMTRNLSMRSHITVSPEVWLNLTVDNSGKKHKDYVFEEGTLEIHKQEMLKEFVLSPIANLENGSLDNLIKSFEQGGEIKLSTLFVDPSLYNFDKEPEKSPIELYRNYYRMSGELAAELASYLTCKKYFTLEDAKIIVDNVQFTNENVLNLTNKELLASFFLGGILDKKDPSVIYYDSNTSYAFKPEIGKLFENNYPHNKDKGAKIFAVQEIKKRLDYNLAQNEQIGNKLKV